MRTMISHSVSRRRFFRSLLLVSTFVLSSTVLLALGFTVGATDPSVEPPSPAPSPPEAPPPDTRAPEPLQFPALERSKHLSALGVDQWHKHAQSGKGIKI